MSTPTLSPKMASMLTWLSRENRPVVTHGRTVDALIRRGLAERRPGWNYAVTLTEAGRAAATDDRPAIGSTVTVRPYGDGLVTGTVVAWRMTGPSPLTVVVYTTPAGERAEYAAYLGQIVSVSA